MLEQLAAEEGRQVEDFIADLLWNAVAERRSAVEFLQPWDKLTPREKQVAALACLGYTNQEMAERMVISGNTVKTHVRHVLHKFNVTSKSELGQVLAGWDFAEWIEGQGLWPEAPLNGSNHVSSSGISP
jgi:DNA-binding CsgD family transcriptional regulator